jgi:hypothetical protein
MKLTLPDDLPMHILATALQTAGLTMDPAPRSDGSYMVRRGKSRCVICNKPAHVRVDDRLYCPGHALEIARAGGAL